MVESLSHFRKERECDTNIASNFICFGFEPKHLKHESGVSRPCTLYVPKFRRENADWKITMDTCQLRLELCYLILHIRNLKARSALNGFGSRLNTFKLKYFARVYFRCVGKFVYVNAVYSVTACKQSYLSLYSPEDAACCYGDHPTTNVVTRWSHRLAKYCHRNDALCAWSQFFGE